MRYINHLFRQAYLVTGIDYQRIAQEESVEQSKDQEGLSGRNENPYRVASVISERTFEDDPITTGNREKSLYTEKGILATERERDLDLYSYRQVTRSARSSNRAEPLGSPPQNLVSRTARDSSTTQQPAARSSADRRQPSPVSARQSTGQSPGTQKRLGDLDVRRNQMKLEKQIGQQKQDSLQGVIVQRAKLRQIKFEEGLKDIKPFETEVDISREIGEVETERQGDRLIEQEGIIFVNGKMKGLERFQSIRSSKEPVPEHERGFYAPVSPNRESISQLTPTVLLEKIFKSNDQLRPESEREFRQDRSEPKITSSRGNKTERNVRSTHGMATSTTATRSSNFQTQQVSLKKQKDGPSQFSAAPSSINQHMICDRHPSRGVSRNESQTSKNKNSLGNFKGLANVLSASSGVLPEASRPDSKEPTPKKPSKVPETSRLTPTPKRKASTSTTIRKTPVRVVAANLGKVLGTEEKPEKKKLKSLKYVSEKGLQKAMEVSQAKAEALGLNSKSGEGQTRGRPQRSRSTHLRETESARVSGNKFGSGSERRLGKQSSEGKTISAQEVREIELSGWQAIETPVNSYLAGSALGNTVSSALPGIESETGGRYRRESERSAREERQGTKRERVETPRGKTGMSWKGSGSKVGVRPSGGVSGTKPRDSKDKRPSLSRVLGEKEKSGVLGEKGRGGVGSGRGVVASGGRGVVEREQSGLDRWTSHQSKDLRTEDAVKQEVMLLGVREKFQTLMTDINSKILNELRADLK